MSGSVEEEVGDLDVAVHKAHLVQGIHTQEHLSGVKLHLTLRQSSMTLRHELEHVADGKVLQQQKVFFQVLGISSCWKQSLSTGVIGDPL